MRLLRAEVPLKLLGTPLFPLSSSRCLFLLSIFATVLCLSVPSSPRRLLWLPCLSISLCVCPSFICHSSRLVYHALPCLCQIHTHSHAMPGLGPFLFLFPVFVTIGLEGCRIFVKVVQQKRDQEQERDPRCVALPACHAFPSLFKTLPAAIDVHVEIMLSYVGSAAAAPLAGVAPPLTVTLPLPLPLAVPFLSSNAGGVAAAVPVAPLPAPAAEPPCLEVGPPAPAPAPPPAPPAAAAAPAPLPLPLPLPTRACSSLPLSGPIPCPALHRLVALTVSCVARLGYLSRNAWSSW